MAINSSIPTNPRRLAQYNRLSGQLQSGTLQKPMQNRITRLFNSRNWTIPKAQAATPAAAPATQPQVTAQPTSATTTTQSSDTSALFPGYGTFTQAQAEASPLFQNRLKTGQDALKAYYASKGLTNSGAENKGNADLVAQLTAEETDRAQRAAEAEADRLMNMQQFEVNRQANAGNQQWSRIMDMLNFAQANSPMPAAVDMTGKSMDLTTRQGQAMAKYLADMYKRIYAPSGGGVGPYIPPKASGPDYSNIDILGNLGSGSNTGGWISTLTDMLGGLLR